jgi:hypothetical protein
MNLIDSTLNIGLRYAKRKLPIFQQTKIVSHLLKSGITTIEFNRETRDSVTPDIIDMNYGCKNLSYYLNHPVNTQDLSILKKTGYDQIIVPSFSNFNSQKVDILQLNSVFEDNGVELKANVYNGFNENHSDLVRCIFQLRQLGIHHITLYGNMYMDTYKTAETLRVLTEIIPLSNVSIGLVSNNGYNSNNITFSKFKLKPLFNLDVLIEYGITNLLVSVNGIGGLYSTQTINKLFSYNEMKTNIKNSKELDSISKILQENLI